MWGSCQFFSRLQFPVIFVTKLDRKTPFGQADARHEAKTIREFLSPRKLHPLLEEKDPKDDSPKNYSFLTFAAHMPQIPPKTYNFTQFTLLFCLI